jgi:L-rhamnose-H+ transport protein
MSGFIIGLPLVIIGGALAGGGGFPIKLMKSYGYESWALVSQLLGLIILPWLALLIFFPEGIGAAFSVPLADILKANAFSAAWGVANTLCLLCLARIGFSLTVGILTGVGLPVGMLVPLLIKGSGVFEGGDSLLAPRGTLIVFCSALMVLAVALITRAGLLKNKTQQRGGAFALWLAMAVLAGFLQVGLSFSFVYAQGPVTAAMLARGSGEIMANIGAWALILPGGALVNILCPLLLSLKKRSLGALTAAPRDFILCLLMGLSFFLMIILMGQGMRMLGPLGASIGFGVFQACQISASQGVGVVFGEWRDTPPRFVPLMITALSILLAAVVVISVGNYCLRD